MFGWEMSHVMLFVAAPLLLALYAVSALLIWRPTFTVSLPTPILRSLIFLAERSYQGEWELRRGEVRFCRLVQLSAKGVWTEIDNRIPYADGPKSYVVGNIVLATLGLVMIGLIVYSGIFGGIQVAFVLTAMLVLGVVAGIALYQMCRAIGWALYQASKICPIRIDSLGDLLKSR